MSRVILDGTIKAIRGKIGGLIFRQMPDGSIVVSEAPPKLTRREKKRANLRRSQAQKAHNSKFRDAVDYARSAARTQPLYAELAAAAPMKTAYNFALSDWFHPPQVHGIERQNGRIRVMATDNVMVTRVRVTVLDGPNGDVLETGEAVRCGGDWWEFTPQTESKTILAEAWDLPGHVGRLVV
jgi:hypothetical protein